VKHRSLATNQEFHVPPNKRNGFSRKKQTDAILPNEHTDSIRRQDKKTVRNLYFQQINPAG
jgi:hypothetical protein